jgi:predicted nucleic acid-binding Zn ribbon protein
MPTYVYKFVDTGETIEVQQSFSDDTLTEALHPSSGEIMPVKKVFQPVGVTFKGSGFFKTDNRGKKSASKAGSTGESASSDGSKAEKKDKADKRESSSSSSSSSGSSGRDSSSATASSSAGSSSD